LGLSPTLARGLSKLTCKSLSQACSGICNLALVEDNQDKLDKAGACEAVVATLVVLGNSNIVIARCVCCFLFSVLKATSSFDARCVQGVAAIASLSFEAKDKTQLRNAETGEAVVSSLRTFGKSDQIVAEQVFDTFIPSHHYIHTIKVDKMVSWRRDLWLLLPVLVVVTKTQLRPGLEV